MIRLIISQDGEKVNIMVCQKNIQGLDLRLVISRTNLAAIWSQAAMWKRTSLISIFNLLLFWLISFTSQGLVFFFSFKGTRKQESRQFRLWSQKKGKEISGNPLIWNKRAQPAHFSYLASLRALEKQKLRPQIHRVFFSHYNILLKVIFCCVFLFAAIFL